MIATRRITIKKDFGRPIATSQRSCRPASRWKQLAHTLTFCAALSVVFASEAHGDHSSTDNESKIRQQIKPDDGDTDEVPGRRYREGRLVIADFGMDPPGERNDLDAMVATQVRIHFDYRCVYGRRKSGDAKAKLTRLDIFAVVRPQDSWLATPDNHRLLDHEQGHFDISQIAALAARLQMHKKWKDGELEGTGDTADEAIAQLRDKIKSEMEPFYAKLKKAQQQYDDVTSHGRRSQAQREQRKVHQKFLELMNETWEESEWYRRQRRQRPAVLTKASEPEE